MTAPVYAGAKLGPGTLKIGATGSLIDVSCQVNNAKIEPTKNEGTATTKLCGDVRPGSVTYTSALSGNLDVDAATASGLFALSWSEKGTEQAFEFTPSTAMGTSAAGTLIIDPLRFGADNYGDDLTSDFAFSIVGEPTFTYLP